MQCGSAILLGTEHLLCHRREVCVLLLKAPQRNLCQQWSIDRQRGKSASSGEDWQQPVCQSEHPLRTLVANYSFFQTVFLVRWSPLQEAILERKGIPTIGRLQPSPMYSLRTSSCLTLQGIEELNLWMWPFLDSSLGSASFHSYFAWSHPDHLPWPA